GRPGTDGRHASNVRRPRLIRPMHEFAIIVPMVHQQRPAARLSQSGDTEDMVMLLAPRLAYFAGVARTEHVTRAAQEMQVPQSTLSRAMVRLEQDLGGDLSEIGRASCRGGR